MDDDPIINAVVNGDSIGVIAARRGVSRQAIDQYVQHHTGMRPAELRGYKANSWAHTHHDEILAAYASGKRIPDIARELHISSQTIYRIVKFHEAGKIFSKQRNRAPLIPKLQSLLDHGYSLDRAADKVGVKRTLVHTMANAGEITPRWKRHERRFPITRESLEVEAAKGGTLRDIAAVYGCSPELIAKRLDEYGIPRKKRSRWDKEKQDAL